jgi:hypothetical protein
VDGLADRLGESLEVVAAAAPRGVGGVRLVADHLPAPGSRQPRGVLVAQVVAVRLGVDGQRSDDGGAVRVDVGERRDSRVGARGARTAPDRAHHDALTTSP